MKQKILFVYNWVSDVEKTTEFKECSSTVLVSEMTEILASYDLEVIKVNLKSPEQLVSAIEENHPVDVAFVIAEGFLNEPSSLYDGTGALRIRQVLENYQIPYTHSGVETMAACRNKNLTYERLSGSVAIPKFFVFNNANDISAIDKAEEVVGYPMFIKPTGGGNSIGIDQLSIVRNRNDLLIKFDQLKELIGDESIIAETYLNDREYTVGIIGNGHPTLMPIISFPRDFDVRSQVVKANEYQERERFEILSVADPAALQIKDIAVNVFKSLGARDLIRIDLKQDSNGTIYVIDVNGTPSLSTKGSLAYMAENLGVSHRELVGYFLYVTMSRYNLQINNVLFDTGIKVEALLQWNFDNQVA